MYELKSVLHSQKRAAAAALGKFKSFLLRRWSLVLAVVSPLFTPLLHLDTHTKFVQYIKLAVQECGLGSEWVRPPRLPLGGEERKRILKIIHDGMDKRPKVAKVRQK